VDLANAEEQEVLSLWQGLGYYSRARNLHACAKQIRDNYQGKFPNSYQELLKLKGIGPYTAAAIASFCFMEAKPVVDGNVFRVVSRYLGIDTDIASSQARAVFENAASQLMGNCPPDQFNQAIMEFGALFCTPGLPDCLHCPLHNSCVASKNNLQQALPVKSKKVKVRDRFFHYLVISDGTYFLMNERGPKDIWQGLHDFYLHENVSLKTLNEIQQEGIFVEVGNQEIVDSGVETKHILTHQHLYCRFFLYQCNYESLIEIKNKINFKLVHRNELAEISKPILIDKFLNLSLI
jgi:A/G-specific adenine glycosylase